MKIDDLSAKQIADAYLKRAWPQQDDPVDHGVRIVELAGFIAGKDRAAVCAFLTAEFNSEGGRPAISKHKSMGKMISMFSHTAFALCPSRSAEFWTEIIDRVYTGLWGGTHVYIKSKLALSSESVRHLTPKQIMAKFGVSRSYAYKLLSNK